MSGSHCTPHWGASIHLKKKKSSSVDMLVVGGADCSCIPESGSSAKAPSELLDRVFKSGLW